MVMVLLWRGMCIVDSAYLFLHPLRSGPRHHMRWRACWEEFGAGRVQQ